MRILKIALLLATSFVACQKENKLVKSDSTAVWIANPDNYTDKTYHKVLFDTYKNYQKKELTDSCQRLLVDFANVIPTYQYDTLFINLGQQFLNKKPNKRPDAARAQILYSLGLQYRVAASYDSAKWFLQQSIVLNQNQNKLLQANTEMVLGNVYYSENNLKQALLHYLKAEKLYELQNDHVNLGVVYANIANCFQDIYSYPQYQTYINKAMSLSLKDKDSVIYLDFKVNYIKTVFNFDSDTLKFIHEADRVNEEIKTFKNRDSVLVFDNALLQCQKFLFSKQGWLTGIGPYLSTIQRLARQTGNEDYTNEVSLIEGQYDLKKNGAIQDTRKLEKLANNFKEYGLLLEALEVNKLLYKNAFHKGVYNEAIGYLQEANNLQGLIHRKSNEGRIIDLEIRYASEKKEQQIKLQQEELAHNKRLIGFLLLLLITIILGFLLYIQRQKNKVLKQQNEREQWFSKALMEDIENDRRRIAADLHDSISYELLMLKSTFTEVRPSVDKIIENVRSLSRNLYPALFEEIGLIPTLEGAIDMFHHTHNLWVSFDTSYKGSLTSANELHLYRIIQETLNNVVKHASAHAAKITIQEDEKKILVKVEDNGKGFDTTMILKDKRSFGLHNILSRAKIIGGECHIESSERGTNITIYIPKTTC